MKQPRLDQRIVKPADCVVAVAVPVSRQSFEAQLERPGRRKLVDDYLDWERYRGSFADRAATLLSRIGRLGARVETDLTLDGFGRVARSGLEVILLIAHWREPRPPPGEPADNPDCPGAVELADGFAEVPDVVARIPLDAEILFDLSICESEPLSVAILRDRRHCMTRSTPKRRVTAIVWLTFYEILMHHLRDHDLPYLDAVRDVTLEFWSQRHDRTS